MYDSVYSFYSYATDIDQRSNYIVYWNLDCKLLEDETAFEKSNLFAWIDLQLQFVLIKSISVFQQKIT